MLARKGQHGIVFRTLFGELRLSSQSSHRRSYPLGRARGGIPHDHALSLSLRSLLLVANHLQTQNEVYFEGAN
jgi:hypothetical protein